MLTVDRNHLLNLINIALPTTREEQIAELAETNLRHESYLVLRNVKCEYHEGILTLDGCLPSYYLKQVAQTVVASVPGVDRIDNRIMVASARRS